MPGQRLMALTIAAAFTVFATTGVDAAAQSAGSTAAAAAKASHALISALSKELGSSPDQAAGAAGSLFGLAKSKLSPADFSQVSSAVPGMDLLLKAAPTAGGGATAGLAQLGGVGASLSGAASAFTKLGLSPDLVAKAIPVLTQFVTKSGGANVGSLLAGALK
jgi:Protein of unknown function VcgC/VcgE (DUF2780)